MFYLHWAPWPASDLIIRYSLCRCRALSHLRVYRADPAAGAPGVPQVQLPRFSHSADHVAQEWPQPAAIREVNASANQRTFLLLVFIPEAEFLDVIGTKVFRAFPPCHSQLPTTYGFYSPFLEQNGLKLVCNANIVYGNHKSENSQDYAKKPQRHCTFHEFGFW